MANGKYTADQIIEAVRRNKGILTLVAKDLKCTRQTVHNYVNRYATVKDAVDDERESLLDMAEGKLFDQVRKGNMTAIIFTLKTLGKYRGYVERQELDVRNVDDAIERELARVAGRGEGETPE